MAMTRMWPAGINSNICNWLCKKMFSCTVFGYPKCIARLFIGYCYHSHKLNISRVSHVVLSTDITFHIERTCVNLNGARGTFMSCVAKCGFLCSYRLVDCFTVEQWHKVSF
jgi:hypothetical protein